MDQVHDMVNEEFLEVFDKIFKALDQGNLQHYEDLKIKKSKKEIFSFISLL